MIQTKLCGMRTLEHARAALYAGADYIGFVLAPGYRRRVTPEAVREITSALGRGAARYVGVLVDPDPEEAGRVARYAGLDIVQLSGRESPEDVRAVGMPVFKAVHVGAGTDPLVEVARFSEVAEMVLLDTYTPGQAGGTGRAFDWELATRAAREHPVMIAGGLTPENVTDAIKTVAPRAVDVSSGIETDGKKDTAKIAAFVRAVQEVGR